MIQHKKTLISEEIIENEFVCNLTACKGACCIEGEYGAPLDKDELEIISNDLEKIKPYLSRASVKLLDEKGFHEKDPDFDDVTTCLPDGECVFAVYENGMHKCGIEKANLEGKTEFRKPISCHLYPIRLNKVGNYTALNYNRWHICSPACKLGKEYNVPVYQFLQEALVRKFGQLWYDEMEEIAIEYQNWQNEEESF